MHESVQFHIDLLFGVNIKSSLMSQYNILSRTVKAGDNAMTSGLFILHLKIDRICGGSQWTKDKGQGTSTLLSVQKIVKIQRE